MVVMRPSGAGARPIATARRRGDVGGVPAADWHRSANSARPRPGTGNGYRERTIQEWPPGGACYRGAEVTRGYGR